MTESNGLEKDEGKSKKGQGLPSGAMIAGQEKIAQALRSAKAYPPAVSKAQFFRENGTALAALRRRGWPVSSLVSLLAEAGIVLSVREFSDYLSKHKPKGREAVERRLAEAASERAWAAALTPEAREVERLPRIEASSSKAKPGKVASRKDAAGQTLSTAAATAPEPAPDEPEVEAMLVAERPSNAGADRPESKLPAAQRPRPVAQRIELPGVVQGVAIDRTECYERDRSKSIKDLPNMRPPRDWLIEACALQAFNKMSHISTVVLRNGLQISLTSAQQAQVLNGTYSY